MCRVVVVAVVVVVVGVVVVVVDVVVVVVTVVVVVVVAVIGDSSSSSSCADAVGRVRSVHIYACVLQLGARTLNFLNGRCYFFYNCMCGTSSMGIF